MCNAIHYRFGGFFFFFFLFFLGVWGGAGTGISTFLCLWSVVFSLCVFDQAHHCPSHSFLTFYTVLTYGYLGAKFALPQFLIFVLISPMAGELSNMYKWDQSYWTHQNFYIITNTYMLLINTVCNDKHSMLIWKHLFLWTVESHYPKLPYILNYLFEPVHGDCRNCPIPPLE